MAISANTLFHFTSRTKDEHWLAKYSDVKLEKWTR